MLKKTDTERSQVVGMGEVSAPPKVKEPPRAREPFEAVLFQLVRGAPTQLEACYEYVKK